MSRLIIKINIKIIEPKIVDKICINKKLVSASERKTKYSANYDKSLDFDKKNIIGTEFLLLIGFTTLCAYSLPCTGTQHASVTVMM